MAVHRVCQWCKSSTGVIPCYHAVSWMVHGACVFCGVRTELLTYQRYISTVKWVLANRDSGTSHDGRRIAGRIHPPRYKVEPVQFQLISHDVTLLWLDVMFPWPHRKIWCDDAIRSYEIALFNADPKMDESKISTPKSYLLLQNSSNKNSKTTDLF